MKSSALLLALSTLGTYAHAAPGSAVTPLTGIPMNAAKRLDARAHSDGQTQAARLSGVPMAVAVRRGAATPPDQASPSERALSGISMALAKRL